MEKTNVMRILDQKKIKSNEYFYGDTNAISGVEVAKVLNEDANKVFKTLVTCYTIFILMHNNLLFSNLLWWYIYIKKEHKKAKLVKASDAKLEVYNPYGHDCSAAM